METSRNDYLIGKKFYHYLIPSFLSEMVMHMGTVIDSVIVGNLIGIDALFVDINFSQEENYWIVRISNDGVFFDPTQYTPEETGQIKLGGLRLIRGLAAQFIYTRVMDMNNTIIEVEAR